MCYRTYVMLNLGMEYKEIEIEATTGSLLIAMDHLMHS